MFNLKDNPGCACGFEYENVFHFFLECPINEHIRNLRSYRYRYNFTLTEAQNVDIFTAVLTFIRNSHRFD